MMRRILYVSSMLLIGFACLTGCSHPLDGKAHLAQLTVTGTIGPATTDYVVNALTDAEQQGAQGAVIYLNTRGGLEQAGREIAQHILTSPFPVITYVEPEGAHAGNAGAWVLYASHIAAMSPETSLRVPNPKTDSSLAPGDEAAALAVHHQRNTTWAAGPVTESISLSANQALANGVIDMIATDTEELLKQAQGMEIQTAQGVALFEAGALPLKAYDRGLRNHLLTLITHPMMAYLLLLVGIYGLLIEAYKPGVIAPGIIGAVALLTACYALQVLPVNGAGLALIILGALLLASEAVIAGFGVIVFSGFVALVIGSYILMDTHIPGAAVSPRLTSLLAGASCLVVVGLLVAWGQLPVPFLTRHQSLVGRIAYAAHSNEDNKPQVRIDGLLWQARSSTPLPTGQRVRITSQRGRTLTVEAVSDEKENGSPTEKTA